MFTGYGYQVRIVGEHLDDIQQDMAVSMEWAIGEIQRIQRAAREHGGKNRIYRPRWPMLILRSPKGWTGPKEAHGKAIEGTYHAHQVPLPKAKQDQEELDKLQEWLQAYHPKQLFDERGQPIKAIQDCFPDDDLRMGMRKETHQGTYKPLVLPDWKEFVYDKTGEQSSMDLAGAYLAKVIEQNRHSFRIFSPDELTSNKLTRVLDVTNRTMEVSCTAILDERNFHI